MFQDAIINFLMHPLGSQKLIYLTPIGGFNFLFKISLYVGLMLAIPMIVYQLYGFLRPLMHVHRKRTVFLFIFSSTLLAGSGICFAYFISLPAALHFLTSFDIRNVSAMLTVDSYLAFVITYLLGFAALFQIPLILLIINTIRPMPPRRLMKSQRYVVLVAFVIAAIISPTPDVTNQTILAIPIIAMYQVGVVAVWLQSRSKRSRIMRQNKQQITPRPVPASQRRAAVPAMSSTPPVLTPPQPVAVVRHRPAPIMDIALVRRQQVRPAPPPRSTVSVRQRPTAIVQRNRPILPLSGLSPRSRYGSVDGMIPT